MSITGVKSNHSTTEKSAVAADQSDDAISGEGNALDPNISGTNPTQTPYTWKAGPMTAWQENDDYRKFFEAGEVAESNTTHKYETVHDGDYDDNGGVATGIGHSRGVEVAEIAHGTDGGNNSHASWPLSGRITRRV